MTCGCNDKCELPKALQINNPGEVTLFHRVDVPASQGDDTTYPPKNGLYRNVLLVYLANNHSYLYNSDGIPTRVDGPAGPGTAAGGETGQVLTKRSDDDYDTIWATPAAVNDATLTISENETPVGTFTANSDTDTTIDITVPTKTSDLENDGATGESTYVEATALADYYTKSESDSTFQGKLTAGANITIDANNEISATDTTYTAGEGININGTTIAAKVRRVYDYYTSRPASANTTATGNGGMFTFQATSAMTTGKPKNDASILQLEWDSNAGHDTQLAMTPGVHGSWLAHRHQNSGTWGSWIYVLDDVAGSVKTANIDALAVTTAKIADGAVTATKLASGVLAYSTFEGLSGNTSGYWKRLGNVTFAQHQQGKSVLLRILVGFGNNSNDHQQAFIDLVGQLAWTGSNNGRAGWTSTLNKMNTNATTNSYDIKVIANSITSYDVYMRAAGTYMSATPIFIPGLHSDGTENAVWTPDYSAWTATAPSGTECDIAKVSVATEADLPTVNNATLTIQKNGTTVETFTANSSTNKTANITVPIKTSDLTNDGADGTSTYVEADELTPGYITGEGTDIALSNTQGSRFSDIKLKGDTEQNSSNVLTLVQTNNSKGLTVTADTSTNIITYSGTTNGSYPWINGATNVDMPMDAGTFTLSIDKTLPHNLVFRFYNSSDQFPTLGSIQAGQTTGTVTVSYAIKKVVVMAEVDSGVTISSTTIKLTINPTTPTPSYPQAVQTATGEQIVKITGKNLFNFVPLNTPSTYGVTTSYSDGVVSVAGTATKSWVDITPTSFTDIDLKVGSTYVFSIQNMNAGSGFTPNFRYVLRYSDGSTYQVSINNNNTSATPALTIPKEVTGIRMWLGSTQDQTFDLTFSPQVELGSATVFEPYKEQSYPLSLGSLELCKIGAYQDYIYKSNGTWYLHKEVRHVSLSVSDMNNQENYAGWKDIPNVKADLGVNLNTGLDQVTTVVTNFISTAHALRVNTAVEGTLFLPTYMYPNLTQTQWQTQYPNLVCEIYYGILNQPTDTPITGTLLDDLNAFDQATSYHGNTYITVSSVSPDLPAILSVTTEEKSVLPTATETSVGVVSVGDGLEVTEGGVLSLADNVVYSEDPGTPVGDVVDPYTYSTSETRIGTWIDGKPLYRKVINFGALPNATTKAVAHGLSNFRVRNFYGAAVDPSNNITFYLPTLSGSTSAFVTMYIDADNIVIDTMGTNRSAFTECYITIEYTKTTD